jgi:CDP-paratose 2-epimerase
VTTSLVDPREDFEVNVRGTLNLLDAVRLRREPVPVIFASTNKVYGDLGDLEIRRLNDRYEPVGLLGQRGIGEARALDFHTPYGCSKGAADQYVLDYARTFDLPAVVFRMSCIYGLHQCGNEDQGWVAHFLIRTLEGEPITIYGDGKQVRDILFVDDLVDALLVAQARMPVLRGRAFNIGGSPANTISLLELIDLIATLHGERPLVRYAPWRPGDQRFYVSDTRAFAAATGWAPRTGVHKGLRKLYNWLVEARGVGALQRVAGEQAR